METILEEPKQAVQNLAIAEIIVEECCKKYAVSLNDIRSQCRVKEFTEPRHLISYLLFLKTQWKDKQIGGFVNRDRTSAIYSRELVPDWVKTDKYFRQRYNDILEVINLRIKNLHNTCV